MRLGVYTDFPYHRRGGRVYAEQAFALFVARLATRVERLVLIGRLDPDPASARHEVPAGIDFVPLHHYQSLATPLAALRAMRRSLRSCWRALDRVDGVWLLGPHPMSIALALLAGARGRSVALGVRQDLPAYVRRRHPGSTSLGVAASLLDASYRAFARVFPTVVVGPSLRRRYRRGRRLLEIAVSLVEDADLVDGGSAAARRYDSELTLLSVGRLAREKNPLMLADVLAGLCAADPGRWRLVVCGDGPLKAELARRLERLEVADRADLRGYVAVDGGMRDAYRDSNFLVLTSWTEGLPQVIVEAFAAGLPVVAADVGGIREAVGGSTALVRPGDAEDAIRAIRLLAGDAVLRTRLIESGFDYARAHTADHEVERLAGFLDGSDRIQVHAAAAGKGES